MPICSSFAEISIPPDGNWFLSEEADLSKVAFLQTPEFSVPTTRRVKRSLVVESTSKWVDFVLSIFYHKGAFLGRTVALSSPGL